MARITYEEINDAGSGHREYDDGTDEVVFSEDEWAEMLQDPKFGYVCQSRRHRLSSADHRAGGCLSCESEAEDYYYDFLDEQHSNEVA